jgi:hypothetical protein
MKTKHLHPCRIRKVQTNFQIADKNQIQFVRTHVLQVQLFKKLQHSKCRTMKKAHTARVWGDNGDDDDKIQQSIKLKQAVEMRRKSIQFLFLYYCSSFRGTVPTLCHGKCNLLPSDYLHLHYSMLPRLASTCHYSFHFFLLILLFFTVHWGMSFGKLLCSNGDVTHFCAWVL